MCFMIYVIFSAPPKPTNGTSVTVRKKVKPKVVESETVILTLSSDEEEGHTKAQCTERLAQKLAESSVTLSAIRKEPSLSDLQQNNVLETSAEDGKGKFQNSNFCACVENTSQFFLT